MFNFFVIARVNFGFADITMVTVNSLRKGEGQERSLNKCTNSMTVSQATNTLLDYLAADDELMVVKINRVNRGIRAQSSNIERTD